MTIVEERTAITGGVDTHSEVHVAAALDPVGGLLGTREFPATAAGYAGLLGWLGKFGDVALVGVEGTGSYGAGPGPVPGGARRPGGGGGPGRPAGPAPQRQVRPAGRGQRRPRRAVRPGIGGAQGPRRGGGGDPGADGRQAQRPRTSGPRRSTRPGP